MSLKWEEVPKTFAAKLSGNKITVPVELREMLNLKDGDTLILELKNLSRLEVQV